MQPISSHLHFIKNQDNRFEIAGVQDPRTLSNPFSIIILPEGINGYQGGLWNVIGWILENIFSKAISFETEKGRVYLNKKSLVNYLGRVMAKPEFKMEGAPDWTENKWIDKAVRHCAEVTSKMQKSNQPKAEVVPPTNIPNETLPAGNNLPADNQNIPQIEAPKAQKMDQETVEELAKFIKGEDSRFDEVSFKTLIEELKRKAPQNEEMVIWKVFNDTIVKHEDEYVALTVLIDRVNNESINKMIDKVDDPRILPREIDLETINQIKAFIDGKESRFNKDTLKDFITNLKPVKLIGYSSIDMIDITYTGYQGNDYKTGLLGYAVMQKNREVAQLLFDLGAHPNGNITDIATPPIHFAVQNKDLDTALWLLEKGSVKAQSIHGYVFSEKINELLAVKTPESIESLKKIFSLFDDLWSITLYNVNGNIKQDTIIGAAIVHDNLDVVKLLVSDFEMSIHSKYPYYSFDNYFKTPLQRADELRRDDIVEFLIQRGA
jgi:hypothetical protein